VALSASFTIFLPADIAGLTSVPIGMGRLRSITLRLSLHAHSLQNPLPLTIEWDNSIFSGASQ